MQRQLCRITIKQRSLVLTCAKRASKAAVVDSAETPAEADGVPVVKEVAVKKPRAKKVVEPKEPKAPKAVKVVVVPEIVPFFSSSRSSGSEAAAEAAKPIKRLRRKVVGKAAAEGDEESKEMLERTTQLNEKG